MTVVLDGAIGTVLSNLGIATPAPLWSATAVRDHPDVIAALHAAYAAAGATVHTSVTFRSAPATAGDPSPALTRRAVGLARGAVPRSHRVAGSLAPIHDCWRPDLSPPDAIDAHRRFAALLADAGCDLLLAETFSNPDEACVAARACVETGLPTWVALTPGFDGRLMTPVELTRAARRVADLGAEVVLVNCFPVAQADRWVDALISAGTRWGVYANAGEPGDPHANGTLGAAKRYADLVQGWVDRGASVVGGCCGTNPSHIRAWTDRIG